MKSLNIKIIEECNKSKKLKILQFKTDDFERGRKLKEEQDEHYNKFLFFKNLEKVMNRGGK